jgi:hypothetical protein
VSAQRGIAIVELVCFPTLLTLFGSKYFQVVRMRAFKSQSKRRSATPRNYGLIAQFEEGTQLTRKLHATCIVRLADISFM